MDPLRGLQKVIARDNHAVDEAGDGEADDIRSRTHCYAFSFVEDQFDDLSLCMFSYEPQAGAHVLASSK